MESQQKPLVAARSRYQAGSLELRKAGSGQCWFIRYTTRDVAGKVSRPRLKIGTLKDYPTKTAALKASRHLLETFNSPPAVPALRSFGDLLARYRQEEMPERHSTKRGYDKLLRNYIEPKWAGVPLEQVKAREVRLWLLSLEASPRYRGHIHGLMKTLFRFALLWEWLPASRENPMTLFKLDGSSKRQKQPRIVSMEQCEALLSAIPEEGPWRQMVILCVCLGLRASELFALKWEDVNFEAGTIEVRRAIVEGHVGPVKTHYSERGLPLAPELAKALKLFRKSQPFRALGDWIFANPNSGGLAPYRSNNVQQLVILPAGRAAKIPFPVGWHTFRHTYRSWLDASGVELSVQKDLMRHSDIRTTAEVYGEVTMDRLRGPNSKVVRMVIKDENERSA